MNSPKAKINIQSLISTRNFLAEIIQNARTDYEKAGAIQAFEVSYELVWKTLQRFLGREGKEARSPRETFRLAAQFGYLDNPQIWFKFGEERNLTSHTYQEEIITHILNLLPKFISELDKLIKNLEEKKKEIN